MSVQRDGHTTFRRVDFIEELSSEQKQLRHMMKLHFIDEEFHEANRTPKQHIESIALHGYRTFLWTKDARVALEREHSRLVARVVAVEVAHEILEWMLEGWHFGERPSQRATLGSVPSKQVGADAEETNVESLPCMKSARTFSKCEFFLGLYRNSSRVSPPRNGGLTRQSYTHAKYYFTE